MARNHVSGALRRMACAVVVAVALGGSAGAQEQGGRAQVVVLGTYHFANPGLDVVKVDVVDVLSPAKQKEIQRIVEALARFRPTKVAVEHAPGAAGVLDSLYRAYRAGSHDLTRNETQQIGFRVAARFGHERVHPIDHAGEFPFGAVMEHAQRHDTAFVVMVRSEMERMREESNRRQRECTIAEILRLSNDPAKLARDHAMYLRFARVGGGADGVGADLLAKWYERNIRIFANLQAIASPGDRILVIVGSGHAPILRELIASDDAMVLEDPLRFLPANGSCR